MPEAHINDVRLHYELDGSGDPMVLIHGSWTDHRGWDLVVPGLRGSLRVLRYDRRGHSKSGRPAGQGSYREDVEDVAALLTDLGLAPAHLVGNSFGAIIALLVAGAHPGTARTVTAHEPPLLGLVGGAVIDDVNAKEEPVLHLLEKGQHAEAAELFVETIALGPGGWAQLPAPVRQVMTNNAPTYLDELRDPEYPSWSPAGPLGLERVRCPALLSEGDQSPPFFAQVNDRLATLVPNVIRHTYRGAGHVPHLTHPESFVERVSRFAAEAHFEQVAPPDRASRGG